MSLLSLVLAKPSETQLGFERIEVLWAEPLALRALTPTTRSNELGRWASHEVSVQYICRTEDGLQTIMRADLWPEVEAGVYIEREAAAVIDDLPEPAMRGPMHPHRGGKLWRCKNLLAPNCRWKGPQSALGIVGNLPECPSCGGGAVFEEP